MDLGAWSNLAGITAGAAVIGGAAMKGRQLTVRHAIREDKLDQIIRKVTVNGGESHELGDTTHRTEGKVDQLAKVFGEFKTEAVEHWTENHLAAAAAASAADKAERAALEAKDQLAILRAELQTHA